MSAAANTMSSNPTTEERIQSLGNSGNSRIAQALPKFLEVLDRVLASYLDNCVHCGECAEACHFYLSTGDPRFTPTYKLFPLVKVWKRHRAPFSSLKRALGLAPADPSDAELEEWSRLVYDACTMCGRCTLVCPMGIDIAGAIRKMREGFVVAGLAPRGLQALIDRALQTNSPMGITPKALKAQIAIQEEETGVAIPLDVKGADYMLLFSSLQIMAYPEVIGALARIFKQAGVSWTISTRYFEGTNLGVQLGSSEIAGELVRRMAEAAEELKVKYVVTPECGHVYGAIRWAGPNLLGRPYRFKVIHIIRLLDQLLKEGRIRLKGHDERVVTFHDPCQIVRRGGLVKEPRELIQAVSEEFREMPNAGVTNFCCGGGGGVSANPRAAKLMDRAFDCKQAQFEAVDGLEEIISPCANCRSVLEQALENRGEEERWAITGLSEYLARFLDDEAAAEDERTASS